LLWKADLLATAPLNNPVTAPTADERTMAMLMHILAIFSGLIAPLIFYLVKKDSRFVSFHSLQVLIWHTAYMVVFVVLMIFMFVGMMFSVAAHPHPAPGEAPPFAFFGLFGFVWLWGMGGWLLNTILGIVYAIKANNGEWARYPVIGNFVLNKILVNQQFS
jgi:uncharacterized Tic20 family protein